MNLRNKLLFSFIAVITVMACSGYLVLRWSFERGAHTYLIKSDKQRLKKLSLELSNYYLLHQSWEAFRNNEAAWRRWISEHDHWGIEKSAVDSEVATAESQIFEISTDGNVQPRTRAPAPFGPPPLSEHAPVMPYFLLDKDAKLIVGNKAKKNTVRPIFVDNWSTPQIVGYVGLPPPPAHVEGFWREPFAASHAELLLLFCLATLALSILAAFPLSSLMTRRISRLHHYVSELSQGHYQRRIALDGRDELALLGQNLDKLAQTLDNGQRQQRQLTADISHELRTPVSGLQSYIEAMQDKLIPFHDESLARLHEQTRRLSKLINDLYQLSLADYNGMSFTMRSCNLGELIKRVAALHEPALLKKHLQLSVRVPTFEIVQVLGDEQRLAQVITNLLENSSRYTDAPGRIEIALTTQDGEVLMSVSDSPPGVPQQLHQRLTERLFRVDPSRNRKSGGSGLGLNLCAAIVAAHDGQLMFSDSTLGGLKVSVKLPLFRA